jgi:hypothetical protein
MVPNRFYPSSLLIAPIDLFSSSHRFATFLLAIPTGCFPLLATVFFIIFFPLDSLAGFDQTEVNDFVT